MTDATTATTSSAGVTYTPAQQVASLADSQTSALFSAMGFPTETESSIFSQADFTNAFNYNLYSSSGSVTSLLDKYNALSSSTSAAASTTTAATTPAATTTAPTEDEEETFNNLLNGD